MATSIHTQRLEPTDAGIAAAAKVLRAGQLVAFGTETVYGLGADARNGHAVAQIYAVKNRPAFNPLIVHVHDVAAATALIDIPAPMMPLTQLWPGPLTLVAPLRPGGGIASLVTAGLPTLAVRIPQNPGARTLLKAFDGPVAAPSANTSGRISPSQAAHVAADLNGQIAAILDTGPCAIGLESTIIGMDGDKARLLRPGGIAAEVIAEMLGFMPEKPDEGPITAPGQLSSHYAPNAALRINVEAPEAHETHIGFGANKGRWNLSVSGDLAEAAANLFAILHEADATGAAALTVAPIPSIGLGTAINDRLIRAAAPRPT